MKIFAIYNHNIYEGEALAKSEQALVTRLKFAGYKTSEMDIIYIGEIKED